MLLILAIAALITTGFMARSAFRTASQIGAVLLVALGLIGQLQVTFQTDRARAQATELAAFTQRTASLTIRQETFAATLPLTAGQALCLYRDQDQRIDLLDGARTMSIKGAAQYGGKLSGAFQPRHVGEQAYRCPNRTTLNVTPAQWTAAQRVISVRSEAPATPEASRAPVDSPRGSAAGIPDAGPRVHTVKLYDNGEFYLRFDVDTGTAQCILAAAKDDGYTNPLLITDRARQVTIDLTAAQGRITYDRADRDGNFPLCDGPVVLRVPSREMTGILAALEEHPDVIIENAPQLNAAQIDAASNR